MSLGDRLRSVRKRRGLSQRELAAGSGVSVSLIRKIEQGEVTDTSLATLHKLAAALHVTTSALSASRDEEHAAPDVVTRWEPVRRALLGQLAPVADAEPPTVESVTAELERLIPVFRSNRYSEILPVLPALIRDAQALGEPGSAVRASVLNLAGCLLTHHHIYDTAEMALQRALDDAGDRFDASAVVHNSTWLLIRRGQLAECIDVATSWADDLEPRMSRATHREIAAWGWMLIRVAMAAIRDNQPGTARDAMRLSRAAAVAVGREFQPAGDFLRPFGPLLVTTKQAELAMIEDQPDRVIALSETVPRAAMRSTSDNFNRHLLDVANAHVRLGHVPDAMGTFAQIRTAAPEWLAEQRYARDVVRSMFDRRRSLTAEMRDLADAVRLEY